MNRNNRMQFLYISAIVVCALLFTSSSRKDEPREITLFSTVPEVPATVSLAGEKVDLDRFDMYERFDRELTSMCYTHSNTLLTLKRANRYFPVLEPILEKNDIPKDFVYLAAIESFLNPRAISPAKAAGIWQIVPETAKLYGLEVNQYVDERYHVEKATEAACKYFKSAYTKYKHWPTVAASYNAGMGRISSELDKQLTDNSFDLWLNEETSRYVFRIMAMKEILKNPYKFGFVIKKRQLYQPIRTKTIMVDKPIEDLARFAVENNITYAQLKEFNPWLRDRNLPNANGKVYELKIPLNEDMFYSSRKFATHQKNWTID